jgi:outer membrane murein-binding lipoprotein Lpp
MAMDEPASPADIARLEEHIEALRESIARCRKIALAAKILIGAGGGVLIFMLIGLAPLATAPAFGALAAVIGGIVLAGSNSTTWKQTEARLNNSEALRRQMIGQLDLHVVNEDGHWRL